VKSPTFFLMLCASAALAQLSDRPAGLSEQTAKAVPPVKMFDNLYYVGLDFVCAYVFKTSDGLILIDTLYNPFGNHTIDAIKELGMYPKDIKYVIISHGHDDHYAGALAVKAAAPQAHFMMTDADYTLMESTFKSGSGNGTAKGIIARDMVIKDGDTLKLGDTTLKLFVTPGHTPGVVSFQTTVYDNGKPYTLFYWAGPTLQSNQLPVMESFLATVKRLQTFSGIDVMLHSHPWSVSLMDKIEKARVRKPGDPNPFVNPTEFQAFLAERLPDTEKRIAEANAKAR
jgi:metallo-beta-lactamase class B